MRKDFKILLLLLSTIINNDNFLSPLPHNNILNVKLEPDHAKSWMLLTCRILSTDTSDVNPWNPDPGHNFLALQQKNLLLIWPLCWQNNSKQSILQMSSYGIYKPKPMFARSKHACTKQWNVDFLNWLWGEWANSMFRHIRFTTTNLLGTNMSLESGFPLEI